MVLSDVVGLQVPSPLTIGHVSRWKVYNLATPGLDSLLKCRLVLSHHKEKLGSEGGLQKVELVYPPPKNIFISGLFSPNRP